MKGLKWRGLLVLVILVWAVLYLIPTFVPALPSWWQDIFPKNKIQLGLDLKGGIHLVLEVESEAAVKTTADTLAEEIENSLKEAKIPYLAVERKGIKEIEVRLVREKDVEQFKKLIKDSYADLDWKKETVKERLHTVRLVLKAEREAQIKKMAVTQALETIRNRIDQFGVAEPDIRRQGKDRILIQLPGVKDPQRAINIIGKTARLEFKLVDDEHSLQEALKGNIPPGDEILYGIQEDPVTHRQVKVPYLLQKRTLLTGDYIADARVLIDPQFNEPYVSITFNKEGAKIFARITEANVGKRLAIVLDNKVHSAPVIREKIPSGEARITGNFTMEEARDLAVVLRAGALPAPIKILEERTVGPSLGHDSIRKGVKASLIGGILVVLFMAIYYGFSGIVADIALLVNLILLLAGLAMFQATLTLPGIAGIALTIGMAVDANVLIFERIREELRLGRTPRAAVEAGYSKAFWTIFDANTTTLITAFILFQFGTGPVKGFAVTLSLGILANMFTAIFMCKVIFDYLLYRLHLKRLSI
ncbi:MAG: protein translocase subunit SecD [Candidatus Desulfofervidaceae bacterium]|nr:protein translocase subunit SecD [Candidatus Desulfofervidaceae bacterium]